jgi:hypothetical protein
MHGATKMVKKNAVPYYNLLMSILKQLSLKDSSSFKFCHMLTKEFKPVLEKDAPNSAYMKKWFLYAKAPNAACCNKWDELYSNMNAEPFYILCDCVPYGKASSERHKTYPLDRKMLAQIPAQMDVCQ